MSGQAEEQLCCMPPEYGGGSCQIESLISVDERGQMVLPKEARTKANIRAGDKLALISWGKKGKVCCLCLVKVDEITGMVKAFLGPVMKEMLE